MTRALAVARLALAALAPLAVVPAALAGGWNHVNLASTDGTRVALDYTTRKDAFNGCYKCTHYTRTDALWINVEAAGLDASDDVRVVLVNKRYAPWTRGDVTEIETREIDLAPAGAGRFTAQADALRTWGSGYGGTEDFVLEVAVVVNGLWLVDPLSGTSNFRVDLAQD